MRREPTAGRALVALCDFYLGRLPEAKYAGVFHRLSDQEQEILRHLARALRMVGGVVGDVEADVALRRKGSRHEQPDHQVQFLRMLAAEAGARFDSYATAEGEPGRRRMWEDLAAQAHAQAEVPGRPA